MKNVFFVCCALILAACSNNKDVSEKENFIEQEGAVIITEDSELLTKIKTEKVVSEPFQMRITSSGTVKAIPNNYAEIAAPFAGRITKSFVKLGQKVNVGSPIFEISSPSYLESCNFYYQTKQEMQLADKNFKRQQDLLNNGVGIQKDLEEAEVNYDLSKRNYENAIANLKVYRVNPDDVELGQSLIVRSPIKGEIVDNSIVIGQYLKEDAEPVAIVAELSKVWVVGQLKEKDVSTIHTTDDVEIKLPCLADKAIEGKVYHISEMLDEETRSVQVFIECDNTERLMKPGMYVSVTFVNSLQDAILIPADAVLQMEEGSFVFLKTGDNQYVRREINIVGNDNDRVIINSGLNANDEIITEGAYYLLEAK